MKKGTMLQFRKRKKIGGKKMKIQLEERISDLIQQLEKEKRVHGNIRVRFSVGGIEGEKTSMQSKNGKLVIDVKEDLTDYDCYDEGQEDEDDVNGH